ncbi:hypothetical protein ACJRO7_008529 [Eucalyptus globulus]|uniref:Uncharacterized protein n=1 Tax=Eucalyptus globulus TaxID=34317 RepID=A0ABD3IS11_EUCGL
MGVWLGWILGLIPLLGWLLWWYGDGVGMYRTHLFRSSSIIACFPSVKNIVFQAEDTFLLEWPNVDIVGKNCLVAVHEKAHARLRSFVLNAINRPDALRGIAGIAAFGRCPQVTFENIGKLFMSFEPGPHLEKIDRLFHDMVKGIRAQPLNFPGTAYHRAVQNMSISQNKKGEFTTSEDVSNMKYTNKVVEETIKMANIAAFVFRLMSHPDTQARAHPSLVDIIAMSHDASSIHSF